MGVFSNELGTCEECGVTTYPVNRSHEERQAWRAQGFVRKGARGVCVNCYQRRRNAGTVAELAIKREEGDETSPPCKRCGVRHNAPGPICQDCRVVVQDLGELDRWSA